MDNYFFGSFFETFTNITRYMNLITLNKVLTKMYAHKERVRLESDVEEEIAPDKLGNFETLTLI